MTKWGNGAMSMGQWANCLSALSLAHFVISSFSHSVNGPLPHCLIENETVTVMTMGMATPFSRVGL